MAEPVDHRGSTFSTNWPLLFAAYSRECHDVKELVTAVYSYVDQARGLDFILCSALTTHKAHIEVWSLINLSQLLSFSERTECN